MGDSGLTFIWSSMNAGKSTHLLQNAYGLKEQGHRVELFTAAVDDRAGVGQIASRVGISSPARTFDADTDFYDVARELVRDGEPLACVYVDEAQFTKTSQVKQLHRAAHLIGIQIRCYGIRTDFRGNPFEGAAQLLSLADHVEELRATCACRAKASMNVRIDANGERVSHGAQVEIGGNARYRQVCARCFYQGQLVTAVGAESDSAAHC
ncbi:thymidine kinase [Variovorax sp. LT1P1]|uniref:thymidine kinase n=1 Tax=Variovorax sp. LT1P1 TaxID=3443730 RepID=UPI003F45B7E1